MPGSSTHIAIADKIYSILGNDVISDLPLFFGGNIAPDAIHAKPGYQREDKRRTHLTEGMSIDEFQNPAKLAIFHERVNKFIKDYYLSSDKDRDLYLGYVIHLLTDELSNTILRTPFNRLMFKYKIGQSECDLFNSILSDIEYADKYVLNRYPYAQNVISVLDSVWDYEIKGFVEKSEINSSKHYVINKFRENKPPQKEMKYYSYTDALEFIDYSAYMILNCLSGKSNIIKVL